MMIPKTIPTSIKNMIIDMCLSICFVIVQQQNITFSIQSKAIPVKFVLLLKKKLQSHKNFCRKSTTILFCQEKVLITTWQAIFVTHQNWLNTKPFIITPQYKQQQHIAMRRCWLWHHSYYMFISVVLFQIVMMLSNISHFAWPKKNDFMQKMKDKFHFKNMLQKTHLQKILPYPSSLIHRNSLCSIQQYLLSNLQ